MCASRIFSVAISILVATLGSAFAESVPSWGQLLPVERVVARDIRPGLDLHDFKLLHWAALRDQPWLAKQLLEQGHDVDERDLMGRTPLMVAAAFNSPETATLLLEHGADPMARDADNGDTPLHFAALAGHVEMAALLVAHKADVTARARHNGETPLHYAALYGHRRAISFLIDNGAAVDVPDIQGVRPLQYARMRNRGATVELMLSLGARADDLFDAVNAGDTAYVQYLMAHGADVNAMGLSGTPLHLAVSTGQVGIAVMLIDAGANLDARGDPGQASPLHLAAYGGQTEAAQLLIDRGATVDLRDAEGRTPLGIAAVYGFVDVAAALLAGKADPNVVGLEGCGVPLQYAAKAGSLPIAQLLLAHGARINATSANGTTALHCAIDHLSSMPMIELLMKQGADALIADGVGRTPIEVARAYGIPEIAEFMSQPRR